MRKHYLIAGWIVFSLLMAAAMAQTVETLAGPIDASGGISVDRSGNVYVANYGLRLDNANGTDVFRISPQGDVELFATGLLGASGNDFNSQGDLFQSNIAGGRISRITPEGMVSTFVTADIVGPVGVAVDSTDTVFVANCGANTIARVTPEGQSSLISTSNFLNCPNGLTVDDDGNLYTSNFNDNWVVKIDPQGVTTRFASIPGGGNGHITFANGVLYVSGFRANQIFMVTLDGQVSLLAGAGAAGFGPFGNDDGPASEATFIHPNGIRASPDGDTLYINSSIPALLPTLNPSMVRAIRGLRGLTSQLHFSQFGGGNGFGSELVLYNPSQSATLSGDLAIYNEDGLPIAPFAILSGVEAPEGPITNLQFELPPLGSVSFSSDPDSVLQLGSAVVKATSNISGVVRFEIPGAGIAGVGSASPSSAVMAPVRNLAGVQTGVAIRNPGIEDIDVELTLKDASGQVIAEGRELISVAAQGRIASFIDELFPDADLEDFQGTICVLALSGEIAVVALELGAQPGEFTTLPVSPIEE
ncbi:MAG TPA: hypothetical protein VLV83_11585 [Acidobacteriota bacterium]|nr:hypothetical protein [Acidobacteriota bacterium]